MIFGLEQEGGSLIAPMALAHPLHPIDNRSRNKRWNLWVDNRSRNKRWNLWVEPRVLLLMTLVPVQKLCVNIYIYMCVCQCVYVRSLHEFCYRTYIQRECHSVLAKLHPITFHRSVFLGSVRFLGWMPLFVFFGLPIVSCSLIKV